MTAATDAVAEELSHCLATSNVSSALVEELIELFSETCALR